MEITLEVGQVYSVEVLMVNRVRTMVYVGDTMGALKPKNTVWFCLALTYNTKNAMPEPISIADVVSIKHIGRMRKWYEFWQPRVVLFANQ